MIEVYSIKDFSPFYAKEKNFVIVPFEHLNRPSPFVWPHKHNFYEILWIRNGNSKHFVDNQARPLAMDTIYFMSPGQTHHFEEYASVQGDSIMFSEEFFILNFTNKAAIRKLAFLQNSYKNPGVVLDQTSKQTLEPVVKLMYEEFARADYSKMVISSLLYVFFEVLQRRYFDQQDNHVPIGSHVMVFDKFRSLVDMHFREQHQLKFYGSEICVTPHYLNEAVKKAAGKTASEFIKDRIVLEAKRMLVQSHIPIGQIADELGFQDFSYFSRHFKKNNDLSPEQYRKAMLDKHHL
jgi:AraC family transcriptional activator of pobA